MRTGYLTPDGRYLRLVQRDADEAALLAVEAEGRAGRRRAWSRSPGTTLGGLRRRRRAELDPRSPTLGGVRLLITGSGSDDEFRTLAAAAVRGEVLS